MLLAVAPGPAAAAPAGYLVAAPTGKGLVLRSAPGGRVLARLGPRTAFGTPPALGVASRHGRWLGLTTDALPNGPPGGPDARTARLPAVAAPPHVRPGLP